MSDQTQWEHVVIEKSFLMGPARMFIGVKNAKICAWIMHSFSIVLFLLPQLAGVCSVKEMKIWSLIPTGHYHYISLCFNLWQLLGATIENTSTDKTQMTNRSHSSICRTPSLFSVNKHKQSRHLLPPPQWRKDSSILSLFHPYCVSCGEKRNQIVRYKQGVCNS